MKKVDNRDLPNMQTSQDLIRRYDLSALDQLSAIKGNDNAIGVGMEPTVEAGVQSKDGFYDGNGDNIFTTSKHLPDGDASQISYWDNIEAGNYWYDHNQVSISNMPEQYGFIEVKRIASERSVMFYKQPYGSVYRLSRNASQISDWVDQANVDDIDNIKNDINNIEIHMRNVRFYWNFSDLGYSNGTSLATICSALSDVSIMIADSGNLASGDRPGGGLYTIEIIKRSSYRCSIMARMGGNETSHVWHRNWRPDSGLTSWYDLT